MNDMDHGYIKLPPPEAPTKVITVYIKTPTNPFHDHSVFMLACGQTVDEPNYAQTALYKKLIMEEYIEFLDAKNEAEIADAIMDLIVVCIGYGYSRGWPMQELWNTVHASNMAKTDPETGLVRRREDGKILKPANWTPPDLEPVITNHRQAFGFAR